MLGKVRPWTRGSPGDFATPWSGRRLPPAQGAPTPRRRPRRPHGGEVRRRGDRPVPDRAHVLPARPDRRHARDDPGRRRRRAEARLGQAAADAAGRFRRAVRDHAGLPATIRLLDPPLHEFLPHEEEELEHGGPGRRARAACRAPADGAELKEANPMLACAAVGSASCSPRSTRRSAPSSRPFQVEAEGGQTVVPEVMIPSSWPPGSSS